MIIGEKTFIGIGSTIIDKIKIGENVTLGAGSVVVSDIPSDTLACGVPAKVKEAKKVECTLH